MDKKQMLARQQEIISTAKAEGRDLTAEEKREFDDLTAKIKALSTGAVKAKEATKKLPTELQRQKGPEPQRLLHSAETSRTQVLTQNHSSEKARALLKLRI